MAEEIKFFGFGNGGKSTTIEALDGSELLKYGINLPSCYNFTPDEVKATDPNLFPWPILLRASSEQVRKPVRINSWEELQDFMDHLRDPKVNLSLSLPPQGSKDPFYNATYAYLGLDFVYIHNVQQDVGIMMSMNNSKLMTKSGVNNSIIRLVRGEVGWFVDSIFKSDDPRFSVIKSLTIESVKENYDQFVLGYRAGFFGSNFVNLPAGHIGLKSLIGDPYTFGFRVGCEIRKDISRLTNGQNKFDKQTVIRLRLTCSNAEYDSGLKIVKLHNRIQSGDLNNLSEDLVSYLNSECKLVIPNTSILCGEESNYCSDACSSKANVNKNIANAMDYTINFLQEAINCAGSYSDATLEIPDSISNFQNKFVWIAENTQFRVMSTASSVISFRFQSKNPELTNDIEYDNDRIKIIVFKSQHNMEYDIGVTPSDYGIYGEEFEARCKKIASSNFSSASNYPASGAKYASLKFNNGIGFCLEDGTVVIPQEKFFTYLKQVMGSNFNIYNGV